MITAILVVVIANFCVGVAIFVRKELGNRRILAALDQVFDVLQIIKDYRESARTQHVEAAQAKHDAVLATAAIAKTVEAKAEELATQIKEVPIKVAEILTPSGEGAVPVVPPSGTFRKGTP